MYKWGFLFELFWELNLIRKNFLGGGVPNFGVNF
jgi:hypothetical protein